MKKWLFSLMVLTSFSSFGGNGSSGGGNIFGDQLNPWFINNTTTVKYCVEIGQDFSDLPRQRILDLISESFSFWKANFEKASSDYQSELNTAGINITLGTQSFIFQENCDKDTDLTFLMGQLTEDQKKTIPYKQLIGLAQRTSYDSQYLKGKGFIYIAPEKGTLRPLSPKLHSKPWSYGKNLGLKYTLFHEMGHIFGLQDDHYGSVGLMGARFVEDIASKSAIPFINTNSLTLPSPLGCSKYLDGEAEFYFSVSGRDPSSLRTYLGLDDRYKINLKSSSSELKIRDIKNNKNIGVISYSKNNPIESVEAPAVSIYITKAQKVFKKIPSKLYDNAQPIYQVIQSTGLRDENLKLENGNTLKVFVQFDASCSPSVGAVFEDKVYFDIFWENDL